MDELMRDNPNFMEQMNEWQRVRSEKGEDPMDWGAFRDHVMRIGAPDPGSLRPDEFSAYFDRMGDAKMERAMGGAAGATAAGEATGDTQSAASLPKPDTGA